MELGFVIVWLFLSIGVGALADSRGRSGFGYFLLSFVFSPVLALIVVLVARNLKEQETNDEWRRREQKNRDEDLKREHEKQLESLRVLAAAQRTNAPKATTTNMSISVADELDKLASLRDRGVLTTEEFEAQKSTLLGKSSKKSSTSTSMARSSP